MNPYSQPLPFNQNERKALRPSTAGAPIPPRTATKAATLSTIEEEENSPIIKRILAASGCSNRQEFLAMRAAQQANANGSKSSATNGTKPAAMNRSKTAPINQSKFATNGSKSTNASKSSTNGSKSTSTNPKKKAKGIETLTDTLTSKLISFTHSIHLHTQLY